MRREKLKVGVGLLASHTTLRAQMFNLRLCGDKKKVVYI
jgi:hypothetical protein